MAEERKEMQNAMKQIDKLENKGVDQALAKHNVDGAIASPKKKVKRNNTVSDIAFNDTSYRGNDRFGWWAVVGCMLFWNVDFLYSYVRLKGKLYEEGTESRRENSFSETIHELFI